MKKLLFFIALLIAIPTHAQVPVALSPVARQQFLDVTGKPLAGGALFTFIAGTTNQQATYSESTGTTANSNPIILDSGGFVTPGPLFLIGNGYKFVLCAAFTGVAGTGTCAGFGPQQWSIDNILLPPFLGGNNLFTGNNTFSGTTTFSGAITVSAGGSLSGTFTGSPTFSGTPIFTGGITLTGGTLTSTTLVSPIVSTTTIVPNLNPDRQSIQVTNNAVAPTLNKLVRLLGAPSTATITLAGNTGGAIGICTANCTNTGSATIQVNGIVSCVFDGATTAGDYVVFSATAGNCLDVGGGGYPSSGQVLGRVLSTNVGAGTYQIEEFPADIRSPSATTTFPQVVYSTPSVSTNTTIAPVTMTTVGLNDATYRFSFYEQLTVVGAGCTGGTQTRTSVVYQDPISAASNTGGDDGTTNLTGTPTFNGVIGPSNFGIGLIFSKTFTFRAKTGTVIQYQVPFYAIGANCAPGPQYKIFPVLEQLTSN